MPAVIGLEVGRQTRNGFEWISWKITDNGIGISPEDQRRLFQAFSQLDASVTRRYGGTGLGLALTARLCQLMSGDITFHTEKNKGSEFTIWLPDESGCDSPNQPPRGFTTNRSVSPAFASTR